MFTYTDEQFQEWEKKYGKGKVFELTIEDKRAVLRKPDRKALSFATTGSSGGKDPMKFNEVILNQCWIAGDEEIREDDDYFLAACPVLEGLMEAKQAELKKL